MKILLVGNPNVGKSAFFSRLTGVRVIASNYPGTTVGFTKGFLKIADDAGEIIDVPGTYTLEPTCKAEEVAVEMLGEGDVIINVLDATNLERNLFLTLQLVEKGIPMIIALNMWDDTKHRGISIDAEKLEELLGIPVVPTVAVSGEGMKKVIDRIPEARILPLPGRTHPEMWAEVGRIVEQVQTVVHRHHTWRERLGDASIHPLTGIPIAALVLLASFTIVRFIGEGLIGFVFEPLFEKLWLPLMTDLSDALGGSGFWHDVLVGELINGELDLIESFGMLTTGLFIPFGAVLPYVVAFYLVLGFLEDLGYLPRMAVLLDNLLHRMGIHGYSIIPTLLGMGCNVPGILATRILESKRERFIVATLISIAVPCAALQAMVIGLVGDEGIQYVAIVYGTLIVVWIVIGLILNLIVKGFTPELLIEIPPYRLPPLRIMASKLWMRTIGFLREAIPVLMAGIFVITVLYALNVFDRLANAAKPVVSGLFGLPEDATAAIVIGFLRKDMAIGMLGGLDLTSGQLVVGSVVLAMFFPCIASFVVLGKELGLKGLMGSIIVMLVATLVVGSLLNLIL
ncbi:MAG: ferrous iron transporter B [Chloroflexi bacterium]|nr:ferrous iron transporter B [Chloroflexota bacterium]